ncbi:type I-G CRISPR-associated protein, Cas3-extension family [Imhoffiella purpurea]|uniref:Uncharacterized protein n=1 Tax=Imhoffiella purpurea TaxID=1249627 RepID=W9VT97_9GAMM|nr:hypothetical protein [Imhoffiella purpurea]EXJ13610.1 hypothetical protein D779_3502 [Imhoffiella purpurea]
MKLTALRPENPLAMMAAYGTLRLLPGARLRWADVHPELQWDDGDPLDALTERVRERRDAPELNLLDDPRSKYIGGIDGYRQLAGQIPHPWLSAYACETASGIKGSGLIAQGGSHKFVAAARAVVQALVDCGDVHDRVREALIGPWRYLDRAGAALGWDPGARQDASIAAYAPQLKDKRVILAANWLAWEALPLWPMIGGATPGVTSASLQRGRNKCWRYPTCAEWLGWEGLRALVVGLDGLPAPEIEALGIRLWETEILGRPEGGEFGLARTLSNPHFPAGSRRS